MKLSIVAFIFLSLVLSLGCTSSSDTPTTADIIETAPDDSASTSTPLVSSGDLGDSADKAAMEEAAKELPMEEPVAGLPAIPDAALTIGSKAPSLDIEHWISDGNGAFAEVTEFEADQVYVVEFWATWCGPCVSSMPHLAELQEKFKDSVQVISVSDEDLGTVAAFLEKPYGKGGEDGPKTFGELTGVYCLTTDPDRTVNKDYMEAAGQNGIPSCFVVGKTGEIEWIGHPMALDEPLSQIVDGSWKRDAFAVEFKKEQAFGVIMGMIYESAQAGDIDKANQLVEQAREIAGPRELQQLGQIEMQLKMAPIGKMMEAGDMTGAVAALEKLMGESEGPMKAQLGGLIEQLKTQIEKDAASGEEEGAADTGGLVEPAE